MIRIPLFLLLLGPALSLPAQITDSLVTDTVPVQVIPVDTLHQDMADPDSVAWELVPDSLPKKKKPLLAYRFDPDYPKPKTALLLSLIVPGSGQFYNGKWWKMPIVYGALGGLGYLVHFNTNEYLRLKVAHRRKLRGVPHEFSGISYLDDAANLKDLRDQADRSRQLSYIGVFAVFLLNGAEAFVDAHLTHFDINEDLGLRFEPTLIESPYGPGAGIGLRIEF